MRTFQQRESLLVLFQLYFEHFFQIAADSSEAECHLTVSADIDVHPKHLLVQFVAPFQLRRGLLYPVLLNVALSRHGTLNLLNFELELPCLLFQLCHRELQLLLLLAEVCECGLVIVTRRGVLPAQPVMLPGLFTEGAQLRVQRVHPDDVAVAYLLRMRLQLHGEVVHRTAEPLHHLAELVQLEIHGVRFHSNAAGGSVGIPLWAGAPLRRAYGCL